MIDLRLGDCLELMREIPDASIDLVVTSPPYNKRGHSGANLAGRNWKAGDIDYGVFNDDMPEPEYQSWQLRILDEIYRVLVDGGSLFYNHKNRVKNYALTSPLVWLLKSPLTLRQEIIWDRGSAPDINPRRFYPSTERIYWMFKGEKPKYFNAASANYKEVWRINQEYNNEHPAPFPVEIAKRCIEACSRDGDLILEPFAGSGSTLLAAKELGRNAIGIEINPQYFEIAQRRIAEAQAQLTLAL